MSKHIPTVGEHLYMESVLGSRIPYTVEDVKGNVATIRQARCIFNGARYFNTLADDIVDDPYGAHMRVRWSEKKQIWQQSSNSQHKKRTETMRSRIRNNHRENQTVSMRLGNKPLAEIL